MQWMEYGGRPLHTRTLLTAAMAVAAAAAAAVAFLLAAAPAHSVTVAAKPSRSPPVQFRLTPTSTPSVVAPAAAPAPAATSLISCSASGRGARGGRVRWQRRRRRRGRLRRFVLQGTRWRSRVISYGVSRYPQDLPREAVDAALQRAFQVWAVATPLRFQASSSVGSGGGGAHIDIRWESGEHGDWDAFDGPGGVLAHAAYPSHGGALHFDAAERWALRDADADVRRPSLAHVAAHEIGHALGLAHSPAPGALMGAFYGRARFAGPLRLATDDATGAAALYGPQALPAASATASTPASSPAAPALPCGVGGTLAARIDAAIAAPDGFLYLLMGDWVLRRGARRLDPPRPLALSAVWPGLPSGGVDAAFVAQTGKLYFFKGARYWRFSAAGRGPDAGYPKALRRGFPGAPVAPDATLLWPGNGRLYFFKEDLYWRHDPPAEKSRRRYPRPLRNWGGVPAAPDAAVAFLGHTYFFKGSVYYRFNDSSFSVEEASPPFPRSTAYWWLRCGMSPTTAAPLPLSSTTPTASPSSTPASSTTSTSPPSTTTSSSSPSPSPTMSSSTSALPPASDGFEDNVIEDAPIVVNTVQ